MAVPYGESVAPVYDNAPGSHDNLPVTQQHRFEVLALSRRDGSILWQRTVKETFPHEGGHETGSLASNSPVTDGELVFAFFGSRGLHCLEFDGKARWSKELGLMNTLHAHGEGSSPALDGNTLVVNWDQEGNSKLYAFDKRTGNELWGVARDDNTSWSTPLIVEHAGGKQVVVSATKRIRSYDLATGTLLWECGGLARNVVATPVAGEGYVVAANSYDWQAMVAIRLDGAKGDITGTDQVAWKLNRLTPYVPSPLLYDGTLYFLRHNQNILSALRMTTGQPLAEPMRLPGLRDIFASPVGAAGRVYVVDRGGVTVVVRHGPEPSVLATNRLDDSFSASPALVEGELYLRGEKFLYCLAED
jgi:outer membrane protein assembly factor BamB